MQKTYLIKNGNIKQIELRKISYRRLTKRVGEICGIPRSVLTGKVDKSRLELWTDGNIYTVGANHKEIKKIIRRLRPEEADLLDALDNEFIELRIRRIELLKTAWKNAHAVTLKELKPQ